MHKLIVVSIGLCALTSAGYSQSDKFTQIGSWSCTIPSRAKAPFTCPQIPFPKPFGGEPEVISMGCVPAGLQGGTLINPTLSNALSSVGFCFSPGNQLIKPQGFQPILPYYGPAPEGSVKVSGVWVAVGPVLLTGAVIPKYLVLTVIYAPPGANNGRSTSSVAYESGSTTGTTTSASHTFKVANALSFEGSTGLSGTTNGLGATFDYSLSNTDSQSLEIRKTVSRKIAQNGPSQDGIDHDQDQIWLLLNPTVNLALSSSSAAWMLANTGSEIQFVHVGWLNGHKTMPQGTADRLQKAGITAQDYPDILARDPLADPSSSIDPQRFVAVTDPIPYEPPYSTSAQSPTVTFTVSDSSALTVGATVEETYKVGLSLSHTGDFFGFAKATLKDTESWEWTNKSSQSTIAGTSQSASVTVGGPAYGYSGDTLMQVYVDKLYRTFAFVLVPSKKSEVGVQGTVLSAAGAPLPFSEVNLIENGTRHRTFTNAKGQFRFFVNVTGPATVEAAGAQVHLPHPGAIVIRQR